MTFICLSFVVVLICVSGCSTLTNGVMIPQPKSFLRHIPIRSLTSPLQASTTSSLNPLEVTGEADKKASLNKPLLSAALSLSYMSIIVSIMSLPIALGALNADKKFFGGAKSTYLSQMLATATLATVPPFPSPLSPTTHPSFTDQFYPLISIILLLGDG